MESSHWAGHKNLIDSRPPLSRLVRSRVRGGRALPLCGSCIGRTLDTHTQSLRAVGGGLAEVGQVGGPGARIPVNDRVGLGT